ncbi:conjugal transfer protein [Clostridium tyrobutyricum]|uniref:conjugal transfer protein n=1 Tax=Clostridium tyrobutyricum TaxID=1519 RepID=UPI001C3932FB|nr:conjugal transfer protein [Clostridium tyrobutyricum]MBV4428729.1 conjugal transfer protein [Clostridium tyrobutyricum]MBV4443870.1 conjugal transfer protein [Clostridium tyrobutyricum]
MNFIKRKNKEIKAKTKKLKVYKVNTHKKTVIALWMLLIASFCFAVYKNFTAINIKTVYETKVIDKEIVDTHKIENFIKNFAQDYYTWQPSQISIDSRNEAIKKYLTNELQTLNVDTIRRDIPTSSTVQNVEIWSVKQDGEKQFQVVFTVDQIIVDGQNKENVSSAYEVKVYVDGFENMVIIKNPTICSIPSKSSYEPKAKGSNGTLDAATTGEINEFLKTFFKLYPTATEKELSYYVKDNVLKPIGKDYVLAELLNPIYTKKENQIEVSVSVKYLDQQTKATQISQFDLVLEKENNWVIIK